MPKAPAQVEGQTAVSIGRATGIGAHSALRAALEYLDRALPATTPDPYNNRKAPRTMSIHKQFRDSSVTLDSAGSTRPFARPRPAGRAGVWINDVHTKLNRTRVKAISRPTTLEAVQQTVRMANKAEAPLCVAGGRHAMGGQQFGTGMVLIDMAGLNRVISFDLEKGTVEVEAGIQWPELIHSVVELQNGAPLQWGIRQKQTGSASVAPWRPTYSRHGGSALTEPTMP
jgi:hypothetical protein